MQKDDLGQVAKLFGDPQADVGCPCHQHRIGVLLIKAGQAVGRCRNGEKPVVIADEDVARRGESGKLFGRRPLPAHIAVGRFAPAGIERSIDNRTVAGAAAQVAGQPVVHLAPVRLAGPVVVEGEQRHHEARRAEAALGAMVPHHRGLNRVQAAFAFREIIDGDDLLAVDLAHELNAAVDGLVANLIAVERAQRHRAGAAITLGTAFLGAGGAFPEPQVVEQRVAGRDIAELDDPALAQKTYRPGHRSAPAIGRIAERRQQERHVVVALRLGNPEANRNQVEERRIGKLDAIAAKVVAGVEAKLISSRLELRAIEDGAVDAPVAVGDHGLDEPRLALRGIELDLQARGGLARHGIENMGGEAAHRSSQEHLVKCALLG